MPFIVEFCWQFLVAGCSVYSSVFLHPHLFQAGVCVPWGVLARAVTLLGTGEVCSGRGRAAGGAGSWGMQGAVDACAGRGVQGMELQVVTPGLERGIMLKSRSGLVRQEAEPSQTLGSHCIIVQKAAINRSVCPSAGTAGRELCALGFLESHW